MNSTVFGGTSPTAVIWWSSTTVENAEEEPTRAGPSAGLVSGLRGSTNTDTEAMPSVKTRCATGSLEPGRDWAERVAMRNPGGNLMASHKAGAAVARNLAIGAEPAVVGSIHLRLEHGVGNALWQIDGGEHDLLDDFAGLVAELGLERHGSLLVDPQPVAVAIFVTGMQRDHARRAAEQTFTFAATDFVNLRAGIVDGRQRAEQRPVGSTTLDQNGTPDRGNNR